MSKLTSAIVPFVLYIIGSLFFLAGSIVSLIQARRP